MEVLVNVDAISRIEVRYGVHSGNPDDHRLHGVTLRQARDNPAAIRTYKIYVGGEFYMLPADGDDEVIRVIQRIYNDAINVNEESDNESPAR